MNSRSVVVMGKVPRPGSVKTRLTPPFAAAAACRVYEALLRDVFELVERAARELSFEGVFACALGPEDSLADARRLAPSGWRTLAQQGSDLGQRIAHARLSAGARDVLVLGSDFPLMPAARLHEGFAALASGSSVFGPTEDGGYYLVGLRGDALELLRGIPWSTSQVMAVTRARARELGLPIAELALGYDVDRPEDLERLVREAGPGDAPHTLAELVLLGMRKP